MGFLSGPKFNAPPPPPPPKPAPAPAVAPTVDEARKRVALEEQSSQAKGMASNILAGKSGVSASGGSLKQLLGA